MCECIFCHKEKNITDFVYEDELVMAFMDMDPINEGHVLLVPKQHYFDVDEMPDDLLAHLMIISKKIVAALKEIYSPNGYTIMQNGGEFNDIGHYHLHIFPRYSEDGFGWTYGSGEKAVNSEIAERIRDVLLFQTSQEMFGQDGVYSVDRYLNEMENYMLYELATKQELREIYDVVQQTIKAIYPKYYPTEVVDFFSELHSEDAILKDIENGYVSVLKVDGEIIATGCFVENHITRVYVLPEYQKKGYGTFIVKNIESQIAKKFNSAYLDASLPAAALYEKLGYKTTKHEKYPVENEVILTYEIMEKELHKGASLLTEVGNAE